ncbi:hydroquinone glucosyltransferase-like [Lycium barbarum]|uniref:hydroquinone glucosyltransferase-like n=1 Tax=Lycium barbarum TaxID=112863 RepID=UPI00293F51FE|nr:hydroquinone glucosyltransferase-like [Lycium barbarum]
MAETQIEIIQNPHIALLPTPGMGHLISLVEFAKQLIQKHRFTVTLILPTDGPISKSINKFLETLPSKTLNYLLLPPVNFDDLPDDVKIETRISLTVTRSLPSFRDVFKSLVETEKVVALVVDLFGTDAFDVAKEFNVSSYIFYPTTAMCLSLFLYLPVLDATTDELCEYRDLKERVRIPGCNPIDPEELLDPVQDRKNDAYKWVLHHTKRYKMAEGIVVNSFEDLEPGAINALHEEEPGKPPVYAVGPLIHTDDQSSKAEGMECLTWLDEQPCNSVLYISFGSGGTLSYEQLVELAMGLEMSEQRFLWVIRCPNDTIANATYFNVHSSSNDPLDFLPQGILERTKGQGLVVPNWAPQAQILSHGSIDGFLTHCGWNSTLESVVHGVPLIAWPLYAEQRMNAVMLTEDLKVALRPKFGENGLVRRKEIAEIVKGLMEGEDAKGVRSRMIDLKDAAAKVLGDDGSFAKVLTELASKMSKGLRN